MKNTVLGVARLLTAAIVVLIAPSACLSQAKASEAGASQKIWRFAVVPEFYVGWGIADDLSETNQSISDRIHLGRGANKFAVRGRLLLKQVRVWYLMDLISKGSSGAPDSLGLYYAAESFSYQLLAGHYFDIIHDRLGFEPLVGYGIRNDKARAFDESSDDDLYVEKQHGKGLVLGSCMNVDLTERVLVRTLFTYAELPSIDRRLKIEVLAALPPEEGINRPLIERSALVTGMHFNWIDRTRAERIWYFGLILFVEY
ncbi:MAG TPA: hypothetical protein VNN55_11770 [bacterium]|nr:hypothetical protein [bacterium]